MLVAGAIAFSLPLAGCEDDDCGFVDLTPPAIPNGVYSITADNLVVVRWSPNREVDLAGYMLWRDDNGDESFGVEADGELAVWIEANDPEFLNDRGTPSDPSDDLYEYYDYDVYNGSYYSYALSSFDESGNESELSYEYVLDVPRPENSPNDPLVLRDRFTSAVFSGYDFSAQTNSAQSWDSPTTDLWLETGPGGIDYFVVPSGEAKIQDYGWVAFDDLTYAPLDGWSNADRVEVVVGHTYALWISPDGEFDDNSHYAKIEVLWADTGEVDLYWGYQELPGEPELKLPRSGGESPTPRDEEERS